MSKAKRIEDSRLEKFGQAQQGRKRGNRKKRIFYLIVCEGEKTEPNYFESLKKDLPPGVLGLVNIDVDGTGKNTLSMIEETEKLRQRYQKQYLRTIDSTWAVFDKDSFPLDNFDNAINKGGNSTPKINCAWTNEAFELWYLLHFNYVNTGVSRNQYKNKLEVAIRKAGKKEFKYKKNHVGMYDLLKECGDQERAIKYAQKLEALHVDKRYATHNPCTKVHHLIQELNSLK